MSKARDIATRGNSTIVIPTSVSVGSGSASVGANGQVTFTSATNLMLNNVFTSAYKDYRIVMDWSNCSGGQYFTVRLKGGTTTYSNYTSVGAYYGVTGGTGQFVNLGTGNQGVALGYIGYTGGASGRGGMTLDIFQPADAVATVINSTGAGYSTNTANAMVTSSVIHYSDVAVDSIEIALQTGLNFTGTLRIYGYNNG